jgi:hypothetical protein
MTPVIVTGLGTAPVRGTYTGIVSDNTDAMEARATGSVQITTTTAGSQGSYSMRLILNGTPLAASGRFDAESVATPAVTVRTSAGSKTYRLRFQQEATGFADAVSGVVTDGTLTVAGEPSGGSFSSNFTATRNVWVSGTNETGGMAGKYTLALPLGGEVSDAPLGISMLTVSRVGMVLGRLSLSDGTRSVLTGIVSKDGVWQPYVSLYARSGFMTGALDFTDKDKAGVLGGELDWRRNATLLERLDGLGEKFTPVVRGPLFTVAQRSGNVRLEFSGGGLQEAISQTATLSQTNVLQVPTPNARKVALRFDRIGGGFTGSFTAPGDTQPTQVNGVVLQSENRAIGYFVRNGVRGFIAITAAP